MNSGPSKEQLESLFKTSRKYFDELAKDYYAKDRDFYNKNIAPFYSNPILRAKSGKKPAVLFLTMGVSILLAVVGFVLVFFLAEERTDNKPIKQSEKYSEPIKKRNENPASSVKDSVENEKLKSDDSEKNAEENSSKREVKKKPTERMR